MNHHDPNNIECPCTECQELIADDFEELWGDE